MFKLRQANAEAHAKVVKDLYASLTPEQRAVADGALHGTAFGGGYGRGHGPGYGAGFGPGCGF
jgi:Spy/CpxP family protein refolding chaperone